MDEILFQQTLTNLRNLNPEQRRFYLNFPGLTNVQRFRLEQTIEKLESPVLVDEEFEKYYRENVNYNHVPKMLSPITYENVNFYEVIKDVIKDLERDYIVELWGNLTFKFNEENKDDKYIEKFSAMFRTKADFQKWLNALKLNYNTELSKFSGTKLAYKYLIKRHKRSKQGRGTNVSLTIKEYIGKNCYIPTDENCFYKCVKFKYGDKAPTLEEFNEWLFNNCREKKAV